MMRGERRGDSDDDTVMAAPLDKDVFGSSCACPSDDHGGVQG